ncbi:LacI family DNA-binding transcriptional regulator [Roseinatronobacter alkalisoli]|uniref:LacI family DNA-binding transcriptional regulator n=1 Tax=Roseinatronobacter alkalisoli TaxID=3028235 RepID=A0ABT5T493_9RHOB|nr:LacI family DNA-binding transcriptional regulator [Roseinatronobacter sp. HJB301]MDD7969938.1 LacI family DNA-binding transcriptional regulator [Roseinatronobacter sp. HJB301]
MREKNAQKKAIKLSDVALRANVSVVTVSRALRQPELVSQNTRDKIADAVKTLGYVPNPAAQALASARSRLIGVVIPSLTNQIFADLLRGVMDGLEGTTYIPQFVNTRYKLTREEDLLRVFATQRPAGMIVAGIDQSAAARQLLQEMGCPVVQVMETTPDPVDMVIGCDQQDAGRAAVRHLIDQGYRRIGFLGARMDPRAQRRLAGYNDIMSAHGLSDDALVITTPHPSAYSVGGQLMADLLASAPDADAVFCNNDDVALGALFECQRRGLRVPEQMGIVGSNDLDVVSCSVPTISSVRTHRYETGLTAVNMIMNHLNGTPLEQRIIDAGYDVMVRSSTSRQKKGG